MTSGKKNMVYVAESSKLLSKLICTALQEQGFETRAFFDGMELLRVLATETPACIVCGKVLPTLDGLELCSILKEGSSKSEVPFILVSADDNVLDFWTNATGANRVISITSNNLDKLIEETKKLTDFSRIETERFFEDDEESPASDETDIEKKLVLWSVNAMDKSEFFFNMMKKVLSLYNYVDRIDSLVVQIFKLIYEICAPEAAIIVLDSTPAKVYKVGTENLSEKAAESFWQICRDDYEQLAKKNHSVEYEVKNISDLYKAKTHKEFFESYRHFAIRTEDKFIGSVHLASYKKKVFTYKVQSSIEFLLSALSYLLKEAILHEKITLSEAKLRAAFLKFVPQEVIDDILHSENSQSQANNEKRKVAILMCDIRNFTSISEINQPEDVVNFLNGYFTGMVDIIKKYGGTVDKFIGDAIMVLFGAPISYIDNAQRAVQAALEMYAYVEGLGTGQLKFPDGIKLDIGIGIHYGEVIVGNIGSKDKTNYTVIGDSVNLASRLEGLTKLYGAKVVISQAVREELSDSMNVLMLDLVKVKGKSEAVQVYRTDAKPLPQAFCDFYDKGFYLYKSGAWNNAVSYFEKCLEILPHDKSARLMLSRCNEFLANPPENWEGAIALTSK